MVAAPIRFRTAGGWLTVNRRNLKDESCVVIDVVAQLLRWPPIGEVSCRHSHGSGRRRPKKVCSCSGVPAKPKAPQLFPPIARTRNAAQIERFDSVFQTMLPAGRKELWIGVYESLDPASDQGVFSPPHMNIPVEDDQESADGIDDQVPHRVCQA